ncbi:MAG: solute carrier family 23 protein [Pseudomonadota bacterium]
MNAPAPDLLFGLDDRPPWPQATLAAAAHLLAIVASIATAPLLIAGGLQLDAATTNDLISSALLISGVATLIQINRIGPFGSGLLSIQGTSFAFIGALMLAGSALNERGLGSEAMIGVLLGSAAAGAALTIVGGFYVQRLSRVITGNVTGIAVFLLGLTLVGAAWTNFGFAYTAAEQTGTTAALLLQAAAVIATILWLSTRASPWLRLVSIVAGLLAGMAVAVISGADVVLPESSRAIATPTPLRFSLGFDWGVFLILTPIYFVTMTESIGDLTATTLLSKQPTTGAPYWQRIRGGVMADGLNSIVAAVMGTFPNTTFSQNNGVIALTGVASRFVGVLVALLLIVLGLLPAFSALFQAIPPGVLHATTGVLFAMIALTGLRMLRAQPDQRRSLSMLVVCTAIAFAGTAVPELLAGAGITLPPMLAMLCSFPVATGALTALLWEILRP